MARAQRNFDLDDDDDIDERGVLRDGGRLRVKANFMDSTWIRDLRDRNPPHRDAFAGHRPGFAASSPSALIDADAQAERDAAWQERGAIQRALWKTPPRIPFDRPYRAPAERQERQGQGAHRRGRA